MALDLTDHVALVTGGASGIGAGIARMLSAAGARVVVADIDADGAATLADELGGRAVACDVSSWDEMTAAVEATVSAFGRLDVLVLNAGVDSGFSLERFDEVAYRRAMGVNLDGVVFGLAAGLPVLRADGGGRVLVIASLAGLAPVPPDPVYAANKAAVVNLVRSVAPGFAAQGVLVNSLCPGYADTAILDPWRPMLASIDWPVMSVEDVVAAAATVLGSDDAGQAWLVQYGRPAQPYRFAGIPGPVRDEMPTPEA
jgi:NAD(P)-dependent dehydrogenase (short-subunit alcohol dehydrogenase family)